MNIKGRANNSAHGHLQITKMTKKASGFVLKAGSIVVLECCHPEIKLKLFLFEKLKTGLNGIVRTEL